MAATKFYASWEKAKGTGIIVNAFEALRLKNKAEITTDHKEESVLFDIETGLNVYPVRGVRKSDGRLGQPYFSYYPKEESPMKNQTASFELSPELIIFLQAFEKLKKFRIQERNKESVEILIAQYFKLHRIKVRESHVVVKFYFNLKETKPYSYFYRFNGVLALEFTVTSKPKPVKKVGLAEVGIPLFIAKAVIPKWTREKYGAEFESEEQLDRVVSDITRTYSKSNYLLYGAFKEEAITLPEFREEYEIMSDFERQCEEMRNEIKQLKDECDSEKEKLERIKADILEKQELLRETEALLKKQQERLESLKKAGEDSVRLKEANIKLKERNARLEIKKESLGIEKGNLEAEVSRLKNRSLLQRILNR